MYDPMVYRAADAITAKMYVGNAVEVVLIVLAGLREPSEEIKQVILDREGDLPENAKASWEGAIDHLRNPFAV